MAHHGYTSKGLGGVWPSRLTENLMVVKSMLKLSLDNVNIISELNLCSSNDFGFFCFEPMQSSVTNVWPQGFLGELLETS